MQTLMRIQWWLPFFLLTQVNNALACAVCGTATEASREAFIYSTTSLSLIPLIMIGGLAYYLYWANQHNHQ